MNKKSFISGIAVGLVSAALCAGVYAQTPMLHGIFSKQLTMDEKMDYITNLLNQYYVDELDFSQMEEGVYAGMVAGLGDPYTMYMSAEEFQEFNQSTEGSFYGIGVTVSMMEDNSIVVVAPVSGSPADKAGVLPDDRIIKVNGEDVTGKSLDEVVDMMKGEKDTNVTVTFYRPSESRSFESVLKRTEVKVETVKYEMKENQIGYIQISQFTNVTYEQFMAAYNDLISQHMKGLIIDLRNNPGGVLQVVEEITDVLVPEGTMVYTIDKANNRVDAVSDAEHIEVPLAVLVNGNSASASEILSGAVQDMGVGKLIGTQTFGKGLVQATFRLPDNSGLKVTIQKYYTPRGVCIQGTGITPDYIVELPEEYQYYLNVPEEADTQLKKALEVINAQIK
ncbi:MAG: S41 family peptidase [Clostridiales bacterium]|nr:S41 family peptidase [Clostridiales bacterium]